MRRVPSRYRPDSAPDYSHRFHAGNVGDVWKHCILVEVLRRAAADGGHVTYVESHAGEGGYALGATGEWTEGIGRLWGAEVDDAVGRYLTLVRTHGAGATRPERYPGSPVLARAVLGACADLALWERDVEAHARLCGALDGDANARLTCADGMPALAEAAATAEADGDHVVALVDPPFTQKPDWTTLPDAVIAVARATRTATILLWYPVKSLTRPNAMIARFRSAGIAGTVAELVTTPLEHQRQRLNGSGIVLIRPPDGSLATIAAAAPVVGVRCATRAGVWSLRLSSW